MQVKFKKLDPNAVIPSYAKPGDAGMDLTATRIISYSSSQIMYGTDLAVEIPEGHVGLIFPRSSIFKTPLSLSNSVGCIDCGYRGEIMFVFNIGEFQSHQKTYGVGDRIGQLIILPYPKIEPIEVDELSNSERGDGGFGSTGK